MTASFYSLASALMNLWSHHREDLTIEQALDDGLSDSSLARNYDQKRHALLASEADHAWDSKAKDTASEIELKAARVLHDIRNQEIVELFGNLPGEAVPGPETREMGGKYLYNLDRIERSKVLKILKKMPKGANLHLHFNAGLNPEIFIRRARGMPTMFIRSTRPLLTDEDFVVTELVFSVFEADAPSVNIFDKSYNPSVKDPTTTPWMHWIDFCTEYDSRRRNDAEAYVLSKMVISEDEAHDKTQTVNGIWARSNQATRCFKGLFNYESSYRWYIGALLQSFVEDNVIYAELRPMLMDKSIPSDDGLRRLSHADQMRILLEEVEHFTKEQGKRCLPFGVKVIYCTPRSIPKERFRTELIDCIKLKQQFPELICGFDLVGAEDRPNSINYYSHELAAFQKACKLLNLDVPFLFHAGESLLDTGGSTDPSQSNLYDAILLGSKRIGHGYALVKHPELMRLVRENNISIEVCPISNEILHLCGDAKEHALPQFLVNGLPCSLGSDNPSYFSSSLSHDFYQVYVGWTSMTLSGLRQLVQWSVEHSCLKDEEKKEACKIIEEDWGQFCTWVVDSFGGR